MNASSNGREAATQLRGPVPHAIKREPGGGLPARRTEIIRDRGDLEKIVVSLNQLLADTIALADLYRKHKWQASGPNFCGMQTLFSKHARKQNLLADLLAERVGTLGGTAVAMGQDVFELSQVPRVPTEREATSMQVARLIQAHEIILCEAQSLVVELTAANDLVTSDIVVSNVMRSSEMQAWVLAEHLR